MARIVIATYGSLGDLHPAIALALEMIRRGHDVAFATTANYEAKVTDLGLEFHPIRPDLLAAGEHIVAEIMDGSRGTERLMKDWMFPAVRAMYDDLLPLVQGADLLVANELVFAAPLLAETQGIRWVGYSLAPVSLYSAFDPPRLPVPDSLQWLLRAGPGVQRWIKRIGKLLTYPWSRPVRRLRRELGLDPGSHPLFEGKFSPGLYLALFSPELQPRQRDWSPQVVQTGFCFFEEPNSPLPSEISQFLAGGEPPIVFTLGSAAVRVAGSFYADAAAATRSLGLRAILLLGENPPPPDLPPSILGWDYLPYAKIFPSACAIVHQGGVGTTAQAMRAGRPMIVMPFAHDQFDNASRVVRLGLAREVSRRRLTPALLARELHLLLNDSRPADIAREIALRIRAENGVATAVDAMTRTFLSRSP